MIIHKGWVLASVQGFIVFAHGFITLAQTLHTISRTLSTYAGLKYRDFNKLLEYVNMF